MMNSIERIKRLEARIEELERTLFEIYHYKGDTPGGILNLIHSVLTKKAIHSQRVANVPTGKKPSPWKETEKSEKKGSAGYAA